MYASNIKDFSFNFKRKHFLEDQSKDIKAHSLFTASEVWKLGKKNLKELKEHAVTVEQQSLEHNLKVSYKPTDLKSTVFIQLAVLENERKRTYRA